MHLQENKIFDLTLTPRSHNPRVKVTQNVAQFPLHHVIYATAKFAIAMSNGLGGDAFTRNLTNGRTHARTDR